MLDIHVEPHADRIGGDEIIDLARLVHCDLRIARGGAQRAHDHRRAASETPQHLGHGIDLFGREGDDRAARRQARELLDPGIAQRRKAWAADDLGIGHECADHRRQGFGTQDHGLIAPARVEHAVGEHMPAFGMRAQLRLVDRDKGEIAPLIERHAFGGGKEPARAGRDDALLAGDQCDLVRPLDLHHPVIDLARQQTERKTDQAAGMRAHPLDREVRLSGVGRAQHRSDRARRKSGHGSSLHSLHHGSTRALQDPHAKPCG